MCIFANKQLLQYIEIQFIMLIYQCQLFISTLGQYVYSTVSLPHYMGKTSFLRAKSSLPSSQCKEWSLHE